MFPLLDTADEDALHYTRLLSVEERPFMKLSARLTGPTSLIKTFPRLPPTPPPEDNANELEQDILLDPSTLASSDEKSAAAPIDYKKAELERAQFRQELLIDFANLRNTVSRIQLLCDSNARERERYAAEKIRISQSAADVRSSTAALRIELQEARQTLALRKEYDALTRELLTSGKPGSLPTRQEQKAEMQRLEVEIADLRNESAKMDATWVERRQQFERIQGETSLMMKMINGEKQEPVLGEAVDEREDGEEDGQESSVMQLDHPAPNPTDGVSTGVNTPKLS